MMSVSLSTQAGMYNTVLTQCVDDGIDVSDMCQSYAYDVCAPVCDTYMITASPNYVPIHTYKISVADAPYPLCIDIFSTYGIAYEDMLTTQHYYRKYLRDINSNLSLMSSSSRLCTGYAGPKNNIFLLKS